MSFDLLAKEAFDTLSQEKQVEVLDFIMFLHKRNNERIKTGKEKKYPFDIFSGGLTYIAEDFDETPDCFEEYV
jgi:hypothetical protein